MRPSDGSVRGGIPFRQTSAGRAKCSRGPDDHTPAEDHGRLLIVLTLAVAVTLSSCDGSGRPYTEAGRQATNATAAPLLPATVAGLPSFDFEMFERLLYQLRGTPVVVNIWASWCEPCRAEVPELTAAAERYGRRVQFIGVDIQDTRREAAAFVGDHKVPYPNVFDESGEIHDRLGFVGLPDTVFYAADGEISATWTGPLTPEALRDKISVVLASTAG